MYFPSICGNWSLVSFLYPQLWFRSTPKVATASEHWGKTYGSARHLVVTALTSHLEGDIVGGVALDLESAGRQVVEVLVEEL